MSHPLLPEPRDVPNIAGVNHLALIEVRTRPIGVGIIRIRETPVVAIRGIISGVTVGISDVELQTAQATAKQELQGVVVGGSSSLEIVNAAIPGKGRKGSAPAYEQLSAMPTLTAAP